MKKLAKLIIACLVALNVFGVCAACSNTESDTIKYVGLKVYDPVYIAQDKGFFDECGVSVEIVDTVAGGATATQMVASGDVQAGLLSTMALINAKNGGLPVIGVADIQSAFENSPLEEFFVRADSNIKTVRDLYGKKIAINLVKSSFHYTWILALQQVGLTERDVTFVSLPFSEQEAALNNSTVDAIGLMQPYTKSARENKNLTLLYDAVDCFGERQFCEIFMNERWANSNTDKATAFVSAIRKACAWTMQNQSEAKRIISKYTGVGVEYIDDYVFQPDAMCIESDCEYWLEFMREHEGVSASLTVSDIVTNKFNTAVKQ